MTNRNIINKEDIVFSEKPLIKQFKDIESMKFGLLTVIGYTGKDSKWYCECECGNYCIRMSSSLKDGIKENIQVVSCGCTYVNYFQTHGLSKKSDTYGIWVNINSRCYNKNHKNYDRYGGRGIGVSEEWRGEKGFLNFLNDVHERPTKAHTLDRIDNDKGYSKENCRWATRKEQGRNKSNNRKVIIGGETLTLSEACEKYNKNYKTTHHRIYRYKWSVEEALTLPNHTKRTN